MRQASWIAHCLSHLYKINNNWTAEKVIKFTNIKARILQLSIFSTILGENAKVTNSFILVTNESHSCVFVLACKQQNYYQDTSESRARRKWGLLAATPASLKSVYCWRLWLYGRLTQKLAKFRRLVASSWLQRRNCPGIQFSSSFGAAFTVNRCMCECETKY